jgi:hypothetical protein
MADINPEDEPLFALESENSLEKFDQRMAALIEFAKTQFISSAVRDECVRELEAARKNHYRIPKV